jgi:ubiquinone/menaquinone biosynthesis C-methylase UbiE
MEVSGSIKRRLFKQFTNPSGIVGSIVGRLMAIKNGERTLWAVEQLDPQHGERILEIGYGPGLAIEAILARVGTNGSVAGVDRSVVMTRQARRRNRQAVEAGRAEIIHGSVEQLPFIDNEFDGVLAINSMLFWPDPVANLREIARVTRPGGRLLLVHQPRTEVAVASIVKKMSDAANQAGFSEIRTVTTAMKPASVICVRARIPAP